MTVLGIDVSKWQDENSTPQMMDFHKSVDAGAKFVFIKVSQATYLDPDYVLNWAHAKDAGLPVGGYHYLDWTKPAVDQARFFAGVLSADPGQLPPVVDFECKTNAPNKRDATERLYQFCVTVEQMLGRKIMIYTGAFYWAAFYSGAHEDYFASRYLWIASYSDLNYMLRNLATYTIWDDYTFWQFTDKGNGLRFGAESLQLDMNYFNGTPERFAQFVGGVVIPVTWKLRVTSLIGLRVRSGPGTSFERVDGLPYRAVVTVDKQQGNWARMADGRGWICTDWTVRV